MPCKADLAAMRTAAAALDEAADWMNRRVGTYDEQEGEAEAARRAGESARGLKVCLAAHVSNGSTSKAR